MARRRDGGGLTEIPHELRCLFTMSNAKKEFRCTRNSPYQHECAGQHDLKARQGHYIRAESKEQALTEMARIFIEDKHGFTADCKDRWDDNELQFARLLSELVAAGLDHETIAGAAESMDLDPAEVQEILARAETVFEKAKP